MNAQTPAPHDHVETPPIGAVMVVGGGIAGMQAALDLADQGFKVYLVEQKSAIGGHMAQLDKTFPTNDCAMCSISPKLVDVGRHINIELLTNTEVLEVAGEAGNFSVTLQKHARYIDVNKCVGCGDCVSVCPISLPDPYEEGLKARKAVYKLYSQAVPGAYAIEKAGVAPCRHACPAEQRAQGYIALIAEGRYREALRVIKEDNPFPSVCGRTCHHPCEGKCTRNLVDEPVGIMSLKRFVVDYALAYGREKVEAVPRTRPEWIAIVGAGPAGLTAAHDLVKLGYGVTVFEALPVAGGMMRVGIPAHRLPKGVLQQDIDDILALGVILKTNTPIRNPLKLLEEGYSAVCLATGISTHHHSLGLEGEDAQGVISAATFLRKINLGEPIHIGARVAVIGGGITALDAASVARRLGALEVYLALDRPRGELPAYHYEIEAAEAEGIHILEGYTATRLLTQDAQICGVEIAEAAPGMVKEGHARRPKFKPGSERTIAVDTVILTMGQYSDLNFLEPQFEDPKVDAETLASDIPGLFVVGGRKTGASYIIEAVALGHRVAQSIHRHLQGLPLQAESKTPVPVVKFTRDEIEARLKKGEIQLQPRMQPALLPMEERVTSFREVVLGYTERQARLEAQRCLQCGVCSECLECVYACGAQAIDHEMTDEIVRVEVGAILLAPGYQAYQAEYSEEFGLGHYPNVITALQFERLLSASGPTQGQVLRLSDGQRPKRIAFLQCIGSRDQTHDYCSAVCCMYATKEALIAKEHHPDLDVHIFFMDVRAFSKGYQAYFERARQHYGIQYTRCRISQVREDKSNHNLILRYFDDDGRLVESQFDMVVLSVGMEISPAVKALGQRLGVELDDYGFCSSPQFNPLETSRAGIFAIGPFREPKDIPESVIEASGAAAAAAQRLQRSRYTLTRQRDFPPERNVMNDPPRVGVFVCHCGSNIAGYVDVAAVTEHASRLPYVVHAESNLYTCSQDSIQHLTEVIRQENLNRVVVASCSPLTHGPLFQDSLRAAGLNPYLFEMANIRNQCSWVHSNDKEAATQKAKQLVQMAVAKVVLQSPLTTVRVPIQQSALIVGGGPAGLMAAITLAEQGFPVHLVEQEPALGGNLKHLHTLYNGKNPQEILNTLLERAGDSSHIHVHLNSRVKATRGFKGNFTSLIQDENGHTQEIHHGVTILATGVQEYHGEEYGYGSHAQIVTQQEFEALFHQSRERFTHLRQVAMILCIGPAEKFCSRICCTVALKNALALKDLNPQAQLIFFYKDIRTYGFKERLYTQAREKGMLFVRYDQDHQPEVEPEPDGSLRVTAWDPSLKQNIVFHPDLCVLSMPAVPPPETRHIASLFKVPVDADGFFLEAHVKLRPIDFASEGIFMAGAAHYPKLLDESLIHAQAAASRAARVLSQDSLTAGGRVAVVEAQRCTACLTCVRLCPFGVPQIRADQYGVGGLVGAAYIEASVCQGCGICAAECPAQAIQLMHYTPVQMQTKVKALVQPMDAWFSTPAFTGYGEE